MGDLAGFACAPAPLMPSARKKAGCQRPPDGRVFPEDKVLRARESVTWLAEAGQRLCAVQRHHRRTDHGPRRRDGVADSASGGKSQ